MQVQFMSYLFIYVCKNTYQASTNQIKMSQNKYVSGKPVGYCLNIEDIV